MLFTSAGNSNGGKRVRQSAHRQSRSAKRMHPLTYAALAVRRGLVAGVTGALEGSCHVDALTVLAQVFTQLALVHI